MSNPEETGSPGQLQETAPDEQLARARASIRYSGGGGGGGGGHTLILTSRMFESMRNPTYRLFWFAMMGQMGSMNMQMVARSWYMYELTGSATLLGLTGLANGIPMLTLSLFGGVIADQIQKKYILIAGQAASALIALGIAMFIVFDIITWQYLLAASFFQGCVMALMMPSRQAIIPEIVGEEGLTNAVALNAAGMNLNRLLAPALTGVLIAVLGIDTVYFTMTGLYIVAVAFVLALPRTGTMTIRGGGALSEMMDGLRYIKENSVLPSLLFLTLIGVLLSMPYMMLLPIFTKDVITLETEDTTWITSLPLIGGMLGSLPELFADSAFRLGALMTISGVGAVVGSLIVAAMGDRMRGRMYLYSMLITGAGLLAFCISPWYFLSVLIAIPIGLGQAGRMALSNTLVQAYAEDSYRGRVMSIYMMEFGITNFGVFGVAIVADAIGVQWAIGGMSAVLVLLSFYYLLFVPKIRNLD